MPRRRIDTLDRASVVDENFTRFLSGRPADDPPSPYRKLPNDSPLGRDDLVEIVASQMLSRHLDLAARKLRSLERGYYTISSAGHEANAVLGRLTRATDPAFLHYRSGAFMAERYRQDPAADFSADTLLSLMASRDDPIAGGRHKVWGSAALWVPPQTSTIASHLPKAMGTAVALGRSRRLRLAPRVPPDSLVVCSFGDASLNHSTALGALNAAAWTAHQGFPAPILFVCEDNGLGISVRTPEAWVRSVLRGREEIGYYEAEGADLIATARACEAAISRCRTQRRPAFLHLRVCRLMGHAGSDIETEYRTLDEVEASERDDPLLHAARLLIDTGVATAEELLERYETIRARVWERAEALAGAPLLESSEDVRGPLAPYDAERVAAEAARRDYEEARLAAFGGAERLPENGSPRHLAVNLNRALADLLAKYPEAILFGEDVARKGGVYHVTPGLSATFGAARVFDTLLDEQSILGMAQGAALLGMLPLPEIQYLAYVHNALDQIRGEACSMQFFSQDQFRNPMVIRIAGLAYQKGFGGHFHNDNSIAALRDIPGLVIACPARGDDAVGLLRTCAALARTCGRVVVFLEPIALYMTKDLYRPGDGQWQFAYPAPGEAVPFGAPRVYNAADSELLIITYGNGVPLSLRAAERVREETGWGVRILDLRWLNPLDFEALAAHASACERLVVVDEGRRSAGLGDAIISGLAERLDALPPLRRVCGDDTYIPLGPAAHLVLPSEGDIASAALALR